MNRWCICFLLISCPLLATTKIIELKTTTGFASESETEAGLTYLKLSSLFYGTDHHTHSEIEQILTAAKLDCSPLSHVKVGLHESVIRFVVPEETLPLLQPLIDDMATTTLLTDNQIELAREALVEHCRETDASLLKQSLLTLTPRQVRGFSAPLEPCYANESLLIAESTTPTMTKGTIEIDGKIYMDDPHWTENRLKGHIFSFVSYVTALGLIGSAWTVPDGYATFIAPLFYLLGAGAAGVGAYFTAESYLSDPAVIRQFRHTDLQEGFRATYAKGRANLTLTPRERRNFFLMENTTGAKENNPICTLTDLYDLSDPVMQEMLTPDEIAFLKQQKEDFVLGRNLYYQTKAKLDQKLSETLEPHLKIKNMAIEQAKAKYEQDSEVKLLNGIIAEWKEQLKGIERQFQNQEITAAAKESAIDRCNAYFETEINESGRQARLYQAKSILEGEQKLALWQYEAKVNECKMMICYEKRQAQIDLNRDVISEQYNEVIFDFLNDKPMNDKNFADFIDLRAKTAK